MAGRRTTGVNGNRHQRRCITISVSIVHGYVVDQVHYPGFHRLDRDSPKPTSNVMLNDCTQACPPESITRPTVIRRSPAYARYASLQGSFQSLNLLHAGSTALSSGRRHTLQQSSIANGPLLRYCSRVVIPETICQPPRASSGLPQRVCGT